MWFFPSDPQNTYKSQLEYQNFLEEQSSKQKFQENIERIANGANKKSILATVISILALIISLASFIVQLLEFLYQ